MNNYSIIDRYHIDITGTFTATFFLIMDGDRWGLIDTWMAETSWAPSMNEAKDVFYNRKKEFGGY